MTAIAEYLIFVTMPPKTACKEKKVVAASSAAAEDMTPKKGHDRPRLPDPRLQPCQAQQWLQLQLLRVEALNPEGLGRDLHYVDGFAFLGPGGRRPGGGRVRGRERSMSCLVSGELPSTGSPSSPTRKLHCPAGL